MDTSGRGPSLSVALSTLVSTTSPSDTKRIVMPSFSFHWAVTLPSEGICEILVDSLTVFPVESIQPVRSYQSLVTSGRAPTETSAISCSLVNILVPTTLPSDSKTMVRLVSIQDASTLLDESSETLVVS